MAVTGTEIVPFSYLRAGTHRCAELRTFCFDGNVTVDVRQDAKNSGAGPSGASNADVARSWGPEVEEGAPRPGKRARRESEGDEIGRKEGLQNVGLVTWPGAFLLVEYLLRVRPLGAWVDVPVLELGCGTGLVGIALARAGARVMQMDLPHVYGLARENAESNGVLSRDATRPGTCAVEVYWWGRGVADILCRWGGRVDGVVESEGGGADGAEAGGAESGEREGLRGVEGAAGQGEGSRDADGTVGELGTGRGHGGAEVESARRHVREGTPPSAGDAPKETGLEEEPARGPVIEGTPPSTVGEKGARPADRYNGRPEVVVGADVVYLRETYGALIETLRMVCAPHTVAFFSYKLRGRGEGEFFTALEAAGFLVDYVPASDLCEEYRDTKDHFIAKVMPGDAGVLV